MLAELRRTGSIAMAIHRPDDANPVVPLRKSLDAAQDTDRHNQEQEPEALTAALSLGAMALTLLTSLAIKLLLG
ncbi:MAG TPA: hypothetical protein VGH29_13445 [Candidatus Binataceae bacterium]